jgi:hypothetical protein
MSCSGNGLCSGPISNRIFLWQTTPPRNVECVLCQLHFNRLVYLNYGSVPETYGSTSLEARENLLRKLNESIYF